jgi:TetR/AcrR family transcriptional repressor of nem operon
MNAESRSTNSPTTRDRLLWSATNLIREHGLHTTTVDGVCERAGVSKGAFFHHFSSKVDMAYEAALSWTEHNEVFFGSAPYHALSDPLDRVLGYLDFRESLIVGEPKDYTCLVGTMVQEAYESHPVIREACRASIVGHAQSLEADLKVAIAQHRPDAGLEASVLALHTQVVLQGAFVIAKATNDRTIALDSIAQLRNYFRLLFGQELLVN